MTFSSRNMLMVTATLALAFSGSAQTQTPPPQAGAPPQGTVSQQNAPSVLMAVELSKSLDSKKAKAGDPVEAKTMQDMKAPNGTDIPRGSKVIGHVTQASAHSKDQPQAQLGFVLEKIVTKSGQEFPLRGVLQAVSVPENAPPSAGGGFGPGNVGAQQERSPGGSQAQGAGPGGGQQQSGMTGAAGSQGSGQSGMAGAAGAGNQAAGAEAGGAMGASQPGAPATSGVTGLKDVQLTPGAEPALSSTARNIHLDSGSMITVKVLPMPVSQ